MKSSGPHAYTPDQREGRSVREQIGASRHKRCPPHPQATSALLAPHDMALKSQPHRARGVLTFQDRQQARLGSAIRSAYPQATGEQRAELDRLQILVRTGNLPIAEAHDLVAQLQARQQRAA